MLGLSLRLELTLQRELDLIFAPGQGALGGHAVDGLGDDIGQDEVDHDQLHGGVGLGGPALLVHVFGFLRQHGVLGVARPDGVLGEPLERGLVERTAPDDEGVVVLLLEQELDEILGERDILRELPDRQRVDAGCAMDAGGAGRAVVVVDFCGDRHALHEGGDVGADRVVDPGALAREQEAVVGGVVPGQHLRLHGVRVQILVPLDDLLGLVAVDGRRLAVRLQHLAAVAPQDRPERDVGVGAVADRDTDGVARLLEDLPRLEELIPSLRRLEPGLLEVHFVVAPGERDPVPRHRPPPRRRLTRIPGERIPAAVPLAEVVDEVAHVDQMLLVEEGVGGARDDEVVAGLRRDLGRALREQLREGDRVDAHRHPALLTKELSLPPQLVVGRRDEVVAREERQLALLGEGGSLPEREPGRHAGAGAGSDAKKVSTRGPLHTDSLELSAVDGEGSEEPGEISPPHRLDGCPGSTPGDDRRQGRTEIGRTEISDGPAAPSARPSAWGNCAALSGPNEVIRKLPASRVRSAMSDALSLKTMMTMRAPMRAAVSSSGVAAASPSIPVKHTTRRSGWTRCAATAAGSAKPAVASPWDTRNSRGATACQSTATSIR